MATTGSRMGSTLLEMVGLIVVTAVVVWTKLKPWRTIRVTRL